MDQMASSVGNLVHIDFADPADPIVEKIDFDMAKSGYSLCITDTKGSHVDLTADYAAVPAEMCAVAEMLGKPVLNELSEQDIIDHMTDIRTKLGDRYLLRALHYFEEVKRVEIQAASLKKGDMPAFLAAVKHQAILLSSIYRMYIRIKIFRRRMYLLLWLSVISHLEATE